MHQRRPLHRLLLLLAAVALAVSACSSSGDDDGADGTTTTEAGATTTSVEPETTSTTEDDTTTTTAGGDDVPPAELEELLPAPADVGPDYREVPTDDDGSSPEADAAMEAACPEATELAGDDEDDDAGDVTRSFETEDGRTVEVSVGPASDIPAEDELDRMIAAINDCDVIEYEEDGMALTMRIAAERDDQHGDLGVRFFLDLTGEHPELTGPIELRMEGATYLVGRHSFEILVSDGVTGSGTTPETVPGDYELVDQLAADLREQLAALGD